MILIEIKNKQVNNCDINIWNVEFGKKNSTKNICNIFLPIEITEAIEFR